MRSRALAAPALFAAAHLAVGSPCPAQTGGPKLSGAAVGYRVEQRMRHLGTIYEQSGTWFGAEAQARIGAVTLRVSGLTGTLTGDTSVTNPDRDVRVSAISLGIRPAMWLEVGADVAARRVASPASTVITRLLGAHVGLAVALGVDGLSGNATVVYYPAADVTGDESLALAASGELGFSYAPPHVPIMLRLAYRFERYDFSGSTLGPARLEQVRAVVAGLGIRLRR
jgi:hypothetical protein